MTVRKNLQKTRRWVVKIGSALLTDNGVGLDTATMASWVEQLAALRRQGVDVVLVSSGAVAAGMARLGWSSRPKTMHELQAAAAVGQMGLVQSWESEFQCHGLQCAQVLLTHDDLSNRGRYLNARSALRALLDVGVVPVINENDTVVTDEIRFGDNDTLAALVANLVEADVSVILTDQHGLFDADPRSNSNAQLIAEAQASDESLDAVAGGSGSLGCGGMITKLRSARLAERSGAHTLIAYGREPDVLARLYAGEQLGTCLTAGRQPEAARKQWLAGHLQFRGTLVLDEGAVQVLQQQGRSLLPVGVSSVEGDFRRGEVVRCVNAEGAEVARGLVNYDAQEVAAIAGQPSSQIGEILGYVGAEELIHRDDLVLV